MKITKWVNKDISKYYVLIFKDNSYKIIQEASVDGVIKLEWRTGNRTDPDVIYSFDEKPTMEQFEKITGIKPDGPLAITGRSEYEWISTPVEENIPTYLTNIIKKIDERIIYESGGAPALGLQLARQFIKEETSL
jgi:hypothetical protein